MTIYFKHSAGTVDSVKNKELAQVNQQDRNRTVQEKDTCDYNMRMLAPTF